MIFHDISLMQVANLPAAFGPLLGVRFVSRCDIGPARGANAAELVESRPKGGDRRALTSTSGARGAPGVETSRPAGAPGVENEPPRVPLTSTSDACGAPGVEKEPGRARPSPKRAGPRTPGSKTGRLSPT